MRGTLTGRAARVSRPPTPATVGAVVAVAGVFVLWILRWEGPDWPAQVYRSDLFRAHGWLLWDNNWYGGHYLLSYSVLFPALGATLGLYVAAALAAGAAAWAFGRIASRFFGTALLPGALLFALATLVPVLVGQLPFLAGGAVALLALVCTRRGTRALAAFFALACPLLSPVAGALLAVAFGAQALASPPGGRRLPVTLMTITATPLLVLGLIFPQSGTFPFWGGDFVVVLVLCGFGVLAIPRHERALRAGVIAYGLVAIVVFFVPNPLGGNYVRLASAVAPSLMIAISSSTRRKALALLAIPLALWQWSPAFALMGTEGRESSSSESYFTPLLDFVGRAGPGRLEIPFTQDHWEAAYVAPHVPLARGWERQTDIADNPIFYGGRTITAAAYERWLDRNGVTWVALPDVPLDYSALGEARVLLSDPPYLRLALTTRHWRVWRVVDGPALVTGPARLVSVQPDAFVLDVTAPGVITVRLRYTSAWSVTEGRACIEPTGDGWTRLVVYSPSRVTIRASLFDHDLECASAG